MIAAGSGWVVFENNNGAAITGIAVDTATRTAVFNHQAVAGPTGEAGTVPFDSSTKAACSA